MTGSRSCQTQNEMKMTGSRLSDPSQAWHPSLFGIWFKFYCPPHWGFTACVNFTTRAVTRASNFAKLKGGWKSKGSNGCIERILTTPVMVTRHCRVLVELRLLVFVGTALMVDALILLSLSGNKSLPDLLTGLHISGESKLPPNRAFSVHWAQSGSSKCFNDHFSLLDWFVMRNNAHLPRLIQSRSSRLQLGGFTRLSDWQEETAWCLQRWYHAEATWTAFTVQDQILRCFAQSERTIERPYNFTMHLSPLI